MRKRKIKKGGKNLFKKILTVGALAVVLTISPVQPLLAMSTAYATEATNSAVFVIGSDFYKINGQSQQMDGSPYVDTASSRTMVPIRYLAYACGVLPNDITYNNNTISLKLDNTSIELTVDSQIMDVNSQTESMDVAPVILNGRSYLPARWIAQAFGYQVDFDSMDNAILVYPPGQTPPLETEKPIVDLTNTGTDNANALGTTKWCKSLVKKDISDFGKESFKLYTATITGMNVTEDGIIISEGNTDTMSTNAVDVWLLENDNLSDATSWVAVCSAPPSSKTYNITYDYDHNIMNTAGHSFIGIHRIKYIVLRYSDNAIQFDNPLYEGN